MDEREKIQAEMDKAIRKAKDKIFEPSRDAKARFEEAKKIFDNTPKVEGFELFISNWLYVTKKSREWNKSLANLIQAERDLKVVFRPTTSQLDDAIEKAKLPFLFQLRNISKTKISPSKLFDDNEILEFDDEDEDEEGSGGSAPPPFKS